MFCGQVLAKSSPVWLTLCSANYGNKKSCPPITPFALKSILGTEFLKAEQIQIILDTASYFKKTTESKTPIPASLTGKTVILLFFEPSTRTRSSFELAAKRLGGNTVVVP